ncbi:LytTR family DNA-binding domain-containing protein [Bombilactobacillus mellifer]|uniref:LytTR family DNA-binding domain-containing protein n=1 Tax=Bombilactobacillus mellifer TaxID=1218492 RepID=UPI0023F13E87|nr:LytTR family DNA-binding domain-containing protein [Bombilactobacillus mellifer]MCT6826796.1 LytTR family transcriptional regulator [Bombilactobacillus mellifer]
MKVEFKKDESLHDEIRVEVKSAEQDSTINKLLAYISKFDKQERSLLPIKTNDRIVTIKMNTLIKIEVQATSLTYYTTAEVLKTTGRLYQVLEVLNDNFVQVSRHAIINLNYLESIENGFAGNMIVRLANNLKTDVSRKYLPELEKELGL